jgi:uncharacterized protein (TIGR00269 family)
VQKIKPFCEIPESESALYAYVKKIPLQDVPCPYAGEALRNDLRGMLNLMEQKHAGTKFTVFRALEKLRPAIEETAKKEDFKTAWSAESRRLPICARPVSCCGMCVRVRG